MPNFERHVFICTNERPAGHLKGSCAEKGSQALREFFKQELGRRGLKGRMRANAAGCLDACALGPSVVVYPDGVWYTIRTEADVLEIIQEHLISGRVVTRLLMPGPVASPTPGA